MGSCRLLGHQPRKINIDQCPPLQHGPSFGHDERPFESDLAEKSEQWTQRDARHSGCLEELEKEDKGACVSDI
jgi:hypothetical protein